MECDEVNSYPDLQGRWLLISHVLRAKVTHLYRTLSLEDGFLVGNHHDRLMLQAMQNMIGHNVDDKIMEQLRLPISEGGFGIPYLRECITAARLASTITYCRYLESDDICRCLVRATPADILASVMRELRHEDIQCASDSILYQQSEEVLKLPNEGSGLQKLIYGQLVHSQVEKFTSSDTSISQAESKRRASVSHKESGAFLFAFPHGETYMQPRVFQTACQYRLGLPVTALGDTAGMRCICRGNKVIDPYGYHFNSCKVGEEIHTRHNEIVRTLHTLILQAGIKAKKEPRGCFAASTDQAIRPDIRMYQPGSLAGIRNNMQDIVVDVRITDPLCSSNINGDSIRRSEQDKYRMYQQHSYVANLHLVPVVMECFGKFSELTSSLLKALVKRVYQRNPDHMPECRLIHYWTKRFSCVLQRCQAELVLSRYDRVQMRHSGNEYCVDECMVSSVVSDVAV
jgi:hypothetical protein